MRRRVVILGGGMAGLAAAWRLSDPDGERPEVTVYQRGWRLGGKGASSRGPHGRIEEHGLHVWLGFYDNAFRLLRSCYEELDRPRTDPGCPIQDWRDAFVPASTIGLGRTGGTDAPLWLAQFPENDRLPGAATGADELTSADFLERGLALLGRFGTSLDPPSVAAPRVVLSSSPTHPALARRATPPGAELLQGARTGLRAVAGSGMAARRSAELTELLGTMLRGIIADRLTVRGYGAVDHLDLREWLVRHGASPEAIDSPIVHGHYDLSFAYEAGDVARPRFPAGLALHLTMRMFLDYKGALFWKMRAGMGDVVFAPLYQALRRRGVRFRFFHRLDQLHLSADGRSVRAVGLGRQVRVSGEEYDPLMRVRGLPVFADRPDLRQLDAGDDLLGHDLESHWCEWGDSDRLTLEAGRDFDSLVLAVSLGMVPHTCGELLEADERWRSMVERVGTVATQAFQAWLRADERSLGWRSAAATVTGCGRPFDTFGSLSQVLPFEDWPDDDRPLTAASFCGTLPDAEITEGNNLGDVVRSNAVRFLESRSRMLWPGAASAGGGFRWDLLCAADAESSTGPARFGSQHWRANIDPSDRYVQSLPGSAAFRLPADESGLDNLFLAGDWIDNGMNAGCIEAAVLGGLQAANAIEGRPLDERTSGGYRPRGTAHRA
ncbi:MAG TPA: FAD-dependent oxidoreductase [Solirubrobacterales bacterium]